jgi:glycerol kinase
MAKCILALDQGTTSSRSVLYDEYFEVLGTQQKEFPQIYPETAWVEHDPLVLWNTQLETAKKVLLDNQLMPADIDGIAITNQRETTVIWNTITGKPIYNAIVWQDRRTGEYCKGLADQGREKLIKSKTGLVLDPYFSATKIKWILDNVSGARDLADQGLLAFGTIDSWLVWNLTGGKFHITDVSNASRTMLFNIHTLEWDEELLEIFDIPRSILPSVVDTAGDLAVTDAALFGVEIPINAIVGDQQSALFGQLCTEAGMAKSTFGTGCFLMLNTGDKVLNSEHKMLSTIAWKINDSVSYALEGSVFVGGAVIQWLRDEMDFFVEASDSEILAEAAGDNGGVYFVPALTGLGAPYWDPNARGAIFGITRGTSKAHLTRAALESICFQVNDVLVAMEQDLKSEISQLRVDGGAAANELLLQFQSDISGTDVLKPFQIETTALGAAFLASIGSGKHTIETIKDKWKLDKSFTPKMDSNRVAHLQERWKEAVKRSLNWN